MGEDDAGVSSGKLTGHYRLLVLDTASVQQRIGVDEQFFVLPVAPGQYRLDRCTDYVQFTFTDGVPAGVAGGPRLSAKQVIVHRPAGAATAALVMKGVSISLIADEPPAGGKLTYPNAGASGMGHVTLQEKYSGGEIPDGFPLVAGPDGFAVETGNRDLRCDITHAPTASLLIREEAALKFVMATPAGSPRGRAEFVGDLTARGNIIMRLAGAGLSITGSDDDGAATPVPGAVSRLSIEADLAVVSAFHGTTVQASYSHPPDTSSPIVQMRGFARQFQFFIRMPKAAGAAIRDEDVQLLFLDQRVISKAGYSDHRQRFHGLWVAGLSSVRTAVEWLDCAAAIATRTAGGRFEVQAGSAGLRRIDDGSVLPAQPLVPKIMAGGVRQLQIPVGALRIKVDADATGGFSMDTALGTLSILNPSMEGRPNGVAGKADADTHAGEAYVPWVLRRSDAMPLDLSASGLRPSEPDGNWASAFDYDEQRFRLLEQPGVGFTMQRDRAGVHRVEPAGVAAGKSVRRTELKEYSNPDGSKTLAVTALCAALSYMRIATGDWRFLDPGDVKLRFNLIEDKKLLELTKGWAPDDVRIVLGAHTKSTAALHAFIDENQPQPTNGLYLPFVGPVAVVLKGREPGADDTAPILYCDELAYGKWPSKTTVLAIDMSEVAGLPFEDVFPDLPGHSWEDVASDDLDLWPVIRSKGKGQEKDPSAVTWKGLFYRNMPLNLVLEPKADHEIRTHFPTLAGLLDAINGGLRLDYGWYDEKGATWRGELDCQDNPIELLPTISDYVSITLRYVLTKGSAGNPTAGAVSIRVALPLLSERGAPAADVPSLDGNITFDLASDNPFARVALRGGKGPFDTQRVPGFDKVRFAGISTDFQNARIDLELFPSDRIKAVFKAFDVPPGEPFKAGIALNLKAGIGKSFSLVIPHEVKSTLFDKYPVVIQGIQLDMSDRASLTFVCQLGLGIPGVDTVGLRVVLQEVDGGGWDMQVLPEGIQGEFSFADTKVRAKIEWRGPTGVAQPSMQAREFWGELNLEGGIFDSYALALRIGAVGERPYWIAGLKTDEIRIGSATIEEPVLLLAHAADTTPELRKIVTDPAASLKPIRPASADRSKQEREAWLSSWQPSTDMGTVFAASGYLRFDKTFATSTKDKDNSDGKYLTNIILTDAGLARLDAWVRLLGSDQGLVRLVLGVDFNEGMISAGVQLPEMAIPDKEHAKYRIDPGFMYASVSYKGPLRFKLSVGWPDRVSGPGIERDWSKSTRIYLDTMWPINTFWGGWQFEYRDNERLTYGMAIRAGWTKTYPAGAKGVAYAEADIGVTLGGVLIFDYGVLSRRQAQLMTQLRTLLQSAAAPLDSLADAQALSLMPSMQLAQTWLGVMARETAADDADDIRLTAELYGDIWGRGYAEFLGITLASIKIAAYARFETQGTMRHGITRCLAITGYTVDVEIACVRYSAYVEVEIWVVKD
ncbi:hypothetical protein A9O66_07565 [Paraburkholderia caribensis]|uniref:Uncharacterized protein n=1 Tax=Paraburkholderia caribensis TaxID=75105 RepID=A0A9Q6S168_9BURK|nr:hypothetical protein A9O66_07565 [Paraburkholderia caribensis]